MNRETQIQNIMATGISRSDALALLGPPKYINANPLNHTAPNGTAFTAERSDMSTGLVIADKCKSEVSFARDMADFVHYYTTTIIPDLDPDEDPFVGWEKVRITIRKL